MNCFICKKEFNTGTADSHEYRCTICDTAICETCHYSNSKYREIPEEGKSNCLGVLCPKCRNTVHFEEM